MCRPLLPPPSCRFLDMYGDVVMGIPHHLFEEQLEKLKAGRGGGVGGWRHGGQPGSGGGDVG